MPKNIFDRARIKLTVTYTIAVIIIFVGSFLLNTWFDKILAEPSVDPLLRLGEALTVILVSILSFYAAGRTLRPIETNYKLQKKFVANAAHELRTPLAIMKTGAESVLATTPTKDDCLKLLVGLVEEVDHMTATVNDMLFLAQYDQHQKVSFKKFNLSALVQKQIALTLPYAAIKQIALIEDCPEFCFVNGDEPSLRRLFNNLLRNAIDYNKLNGKITVSLQKNSKGIELSVVDTGIGIAKNEIKYIFDRFYKTDQARTYNFSGAGLGLAIVKEIVTSHSGQIAVQSQPNKGTSFVVIFPAYS